jgi:hypothetical protein
MIFSSPLSMAITGIIFALLFIAALSFLIYYGLVSALIYGFGGFLFVGLLGIMMGKEGFEKRWWLALFVPILFFFGWFSDRMGSFGLSLVPFTYQQFALSSNTWDSGEAAMVSGSFIIALVALALAIFAVALLYFKVGKKRRK